MPPSETLHWLSQGEIRRQILTHLKQPSTPKQLAMQHSLSLDSCCSLLWELGVYGLLTCLNPPARRSRVYWLTPLGVSCQRTLRLQQGLPPRKQDFPEVDWDLYGWVCFTHRSAIIRAMHGGNTGGGGMQPSAIRRRACQQNASLRMSANNTRDVMRLFLAKGIVCPVRIRKKKYLRYELTETGKQLQALLNRTCS